MVSSCFSRSVHSTFLSKQGHFRPSTTIRSQSTGPLFFFKPKVKIAVSQYVMLQIAFTLKRLHGTLALLLTLQCLWLVCVYTVSLTHATWEMIVSFRHYPSRTVFISSKGIILYVVLFHCFICMLIIFTAVTFYISICFWKWVKPYKLKISLLSVLAQSNPLIFFFDIDNHDCKLLYMRNNKTFTDAVQGSDFTSRR